MPHISTFWRFRLIWFALTISLIPCIFLSAGEDALVSEARIIRERLPLIVGSNFKTQSKIVVLSRDDVLNKLKEEIDHETTPEEFLAREEMLIRFGFASADFKFREAMLRLLTSQLGGFYVPRNKTLFLIKGVPFQDSVTAHELTHALQDQYHDLEKLTKERKKNSDAESALIALVEGEAVISMGIYMQKHSSGWKIAQGAIQTLFATPAQQQSLQAVPLIISKSLMFPYIDGMTFVSFAVHERGMSHIRNLYKDIPESTEQVLHPYKYFHRRDRPTGINLEGAATAVGWVEASQDTLGEFAIAILLETTGVSPTAARTAARGWDGDRYLLLKKGQQRSLIWLSTWDTKGHAHRFLKAFSASLSKRFRTAKEREESPRDRWTRTDDNDILCIRWDREVLVLDGIPPGKLKSLRQLLTTKKKRGTLFSPDNRNDAEEQGTGIDGAY